MLWSSAELGDNYLWALLFCSRLVSFTWTQSCDPFVLIPNMLLEKKKPTRHTHNAFSHHPNNKPKPSPHSNPKRSLTLALEQRSSLKKWQKSDNPPKCSHSKNTNIFLKKWASPLIWLKAVGASKATCWSHSTAVFIQGNFEKKTPGKCCCCFSETISFHLDEKTVLGSCHIHPQWGWDDFGKPSDLQNLSRLQSRSWMGLGWVRWNAFMSCLVLLPE